MDGGIMRNVHRSLTRPASLVLTLLLATTLSSCAKKETDETTSTVSTPVESTQTTAPAPSDAEIAATVTAANDADIENGKLALSKSGNADVKAFAREMVQAHTALNKQGADLVAKLGVTPVDNATTTQLKQSAESTRQMLKGLSGAEFDKAYANNEVDLHQSVLDQLDNTLIPSAQNAELKSLLQSARPIVSAHLDHAKEMKSKLGA
jgi:putative membrane protein